MTQKREGGTGAAGAGGQIHARRRDPLSSRRRMPVWIHTLSVWIHTLSPDHLILNRWQWRGVHRLVHGVVRVSEK